MSSAIAVTSLPSQVLVEEYFSVDGTSRGLAGQPLTLTIDNQFQLGAGTVPQNGLWSVRFRFTTAGDRRLVFSAQAPQGDIVRSQPVNIRVVQGTPLPIQVTSFPHQVRIEEFLTVNGIAFGYAGRPLTLTIDDRFEMGAGIIPTSGNWSVRFRFTDAGVRQLVFSVQDVMGRTHRSPAVAITVLDQAPVGTLRITDVPTSVREREAFSIRGTSTGLTGQPFLLTVDNQLSTQGGTIATDGTWQSQFQFLQSGSRRLTASVAQSPNPILSQTVTVNVLPASPRLTITPPTPPIRTGQNFVLQGEARNMEDGEQLIVQADRQYVLARPTVRSQRWQATLFFHQGGQRLVEVIASDQERESILLTVETPPDNFQIFPYTVWRSTSTPDNIPDLVNPRRMTLHHTVIAALSANATQVQEIQRMRRILDIHLNSSGYSDIGYHYIVMPSGRVYEGRSSRKRGAHDRVNDGFGIAVDGDFQGSMRISEQQFDAIVSLCTVLCRRMGITDPVTPVSTSTFSFGTQMLPRIMGHRDRVSTACPGTVYQRLDEIRQAVRRSLNS